MMAAMCIAIMSIGSLIESMDLSLSILAGLVIMILSAEFGDQKALTVYAVAGVLSLLLPIKTAAIFFLGLFGWYPVVQKKINMLPPIWARGVKLLLFNALMAAFLLLSAFFTGTQEGKTIYIALAVLGNLCFYLYDLLLDRFLIWYLLRIRKRFNWK